MNELIYKQAAIDEITEYGSGDAIFMSVGELKRRIEHLPSVQPERCEDCENFSKTRLLIPQPEVAKDTNAPSTDLISRQAAIDTEGLDEQIRCEMCRNPMHTNRGCDGNCKYDEKLYERIMQILSERMKPLSSVQPEIIRCCDCAKCQYDTLFDQHWCNGREVREDFYCGDAERKTDGFR